MAERIRNISAFASRVFICEDCGRRSYFDAVHFDAERMPADLQKLVKDVVAIDKRIKEKNSRLSAELNFVIEPLTVKCQHCNAEFAPLSS